MRPEEPTSPLAIRHTAQSRPITEEISVDATLDVRGLWCPLPPLKTLKALRAMKPGEVLEVLGTNPVGNRVAPWVVEKLGDQLLSFVEDDGGFHRFYFRRSE